MFSLAQYGIVTVGTIVLWCFSYATFAVEISFSGAGAGLQQAIDDATIVCDSRQMLANSKTIFIRKAITLKGLTARLLEKLGRTPMIVVEAEDVTLVGLELHGKYKTVPQKDRASMIWLQKRRFTIEDCKFYDATKDGIMVTPISFTNCLSFTNCQGVTLRKVVILGLPRAVQAVHKSSCTDVKIEGLSRRP